MDPIKEIRFAAACQAHDEFTRAHAFLFTEPYFDRTEVQMISGKFRLETLLFSKNGIFGRIFCFHDASGNLVYTSFPMIGEQIFQQYIQHSNQKEYFITGTDLNSFILINLTDVTVDYVSFDRLVAEDKKEFLKVGWWYVSDWLYNPSNNLVAVNGPDNMNCGCVEILDFSNPELLYYPSKCLSYKIDNDFGDGEAWALSWTPNNGLELYISYKTDDHKLEMSEEEVFDFFENYKC